MILSNEADKCMHAYNPPDYLPCSIQNYKHQAVLLPSLDYYVTVLLANEIYRNQQSMIEIGLVKKSKIKVNIRFNLLV